MRTDIERDWMIERGAILWRLVLAFALCAVATFWAVPNMLNETQEGSWSNYLAGLVVGIGLIVLAWAIKPMWFIARKPTARSLLLTFGVVVAVQIGISMWRDDMSMSFQLVLLGAACGVFLSQFVATYIVTERARTSEEPAI